MTFSNSTKIEYDQLQRNYTQYNIKTKKKAHSAFDASQPIKNNENIFK